MRTTLTTRVSALESDMTEVKSGVLAILAHLEAGQPAKTTPAKRQKAAGVSARKASADKAAADTAARKAEKSEAFVGWLQETAEARASRKKSNAEMAAWLRSKGLPTGGAVWEAAKKGERKVTVLRKLA